MFTPRAKLLGATIAFVVAVGGLSYAQYTTDKQVAKLSNPTPVVEKVTIVVTPTSVPTATPAAELKITSVKVVTPATKIGKPVSVTNVPTKGVVK